MNSGLKIAREILVQIIPVAIGVYLGLVVNDWNAARQARQTKAHSQELLMQELKVNKAKVEETLAYHLVLLDSIGVLMQKESFGFKDLGFWQGVRTPTLYSAAYQSATLSGAINTFSLLEIHALAEAYAAQERVEDISLITMQGLIQQDFYNERQLRRSMDFVRMMLNDISFAEQDLLASYNKALKTLDE